MMQLPPGPEMGSEDLPSDFFINPFPYLRQCLQKYGNLFTLPLGDFGVSEFGASGQWVFVTHENDLKTLYKAKSDTCLAGKANYIQFARLLPFDGSFILDGSEHGQRRRLLSKLIQGDKNIHKFTNDIIQVMGREMANFPKDKVFDLLGCFQNVIRQVMGHMNFGAEDGPAVHQISEKMRQFVQRGLSYQGKLQIIDDCTDLVGDVVADFKKCPHVHQRESVLSTLVNAQEGEKGLTDTQLQAELVSLLAAGYTPTATSLAWIVAQLFSAPKVYAKTLAEIHHVLNDKQIIHAADFEQLPYLDAVILETCRISPQIFTSSARLLIEPLQIGAYTLPVGTMVANCPYLIHTRQEHYERPLIFDPERFVGKSPDPYKHVFYGGGNRRCLGAEFTLYAMKVVIALLLWKTNLEPVDLCLVPEMQGFLFGPKGGVKVRMKSLGQP
jgi:cytochrome P450